MIPFSPPKIYQEIIDEVVDTLKSGWITTGPKTKQLEKELAEYCGVDRVLCLNSATIGMEFVLRWLGIGEGDEVIIPAYTYCSTANVVLHCGGTPVMVDINEEDFSINIDEIKSKINSKTKAIVPVDIGGFPCRYDELNALIRSEEVHSLYKANSKAQEQIGRILLMSDAAHSLGAKYKGKHLGPQADVSVFSFHAVKNLTTAEGGAIVFNLPSPINADEVYQALNIKSLHGQSKDALAKTQIGNWKYDVIEAGFKGNMTDILASMGLVELRRYDSDTLERRKRIFDIYCDELGNIDHFQLPQYKDSDRESSYHLFMLRVLGITESQRDEVIQKIFEKGVSVNVHFQPLPLLSVYKELGYKMDDYPISYKNFASEISLPVFYDLSDEDAIKVCNAVKDSVNEVINA